ncbi:MAG: hypothetical protein CMK91_04020 [Pseudomonas sp.]|nr:hypothetical protein [Pseudomonas sp.]|tara:strand:- start:5475 stop:6497 length:1023 start_codon:yes stop_codon:yes gene_type:complete
MSRGGVTYTEVFDAHQALTAAGESPTARAILEYIGTGSMTTILKHRKTVLARINGAFGEGGLVSESLKAAVAGVEEELEKIYEGKVAQAQAEATKVISDLESKLEQATQKLAQTELQNSKLEQELQVSRSLLDAETKLSSELKTSNHSLEVEAASLKSTISEMGKAVAQAQAEARNAKAQQDHFEARMKDQMNEVRAIHETAVEQAQRERAEYQAALRNSSEKLTSAVRLNGSLEAEAAADKKEIAAHRETINDLNSRVHKLEGELHEVERSNAQLSSELKVNQDELATYKLKKDKLQEEIIVVKHELKLANEHIQKLKRNAKVQKQGSSAGTETTRRKS